MIWLVSIGISAHHGSELLVGWQWLQRLDKLGPVTPIVSMIFDDEIFLDNATRARTHFVDTQPTDPDELNRKHVKHVYRFWRATRAHLQANAKAKDIIVIVSPAATWFLPWVAGLPVPRDRIFYGPLGPVRLQERLSLRDPQAFLCDLVILCIACAWRLLAPSMPSNVSLRYPAPWFQRLIGRSYHSSHVLPEVEVAVQVAAGHGMDLDPGCWLVLFDLRHRKNVRENLAYALAGALSNGRELVVIGATREDVERTCPDLSGKLLQVHFRPKMSRGDFLQWLENTKPEIVNLSLSEGVPSSLLEALMTGCRLHVYEVGGLVWLIDAAAYHVRRTGPSRTVHEIAWDTDSYDRFRSGTAVRFTSLLGALQRTIGEST
jgi:hypothetical protein